MNIHAFVPLSLSEKKMLLAQVAYSVDIPLTVSPFPPFSQTDAKFRDILHGPCSRTLSGRVAHPRVGADPTLSPGTWRGVFAGVLPVSRAWSDYAIRRAPGALQFENATIGVRESVYMNGNRLISDAFHWNLTRLASATIFVFFLFKFVPPLLPSNVS